MRITINNSYLIGLDQKEEIERLAAYLSRSQSDVVREIIDLGLKIFKEKHIGEAGEIKDEKPSEEGEENEVAEDVSEGEQN